MKVIKHHKKCFFSEFCSFCPNIYIFLPKRTTNKMHSVVLFAFIAVNLYVVTTNEKPWTRTKEVCKALYYHAKTSKIAAIIKAHRSSRNFTQKCQISSVHAASTPINFPLIRKNTIFISMKEECMNQSLKFNSLRQKDLESTAAAQCFHRFESNSLMAYMQ